MGRSLFERRINWIGVIALFILIDICICSLAGVALSRVEEPLIQAALRLPIKVATFTPTFTPTPLPTGTPTPWNTPTPTPNNPSPTPTPVVTIDPVAYATHQAIKAATAEAEQNEALFQLSNYLQRRRSGSYGGERLALAHYFAWFDGNGWYDCNMSAGDRPLIQYDSDDPATISRHIQMARSVGINGFTLHWFAPGDRTDNNFNVLLAQSSGTNFASTIVYSHHIWHGLRQPTQQDISGALSYVLRQHGSHPNFLKLDGKPVIFFTDMYRTPNTGQSPQQFWASVRDEVDPNRESWWIAEGLDPSYLNVFDGLYVFKITHATEPADYKNASVWANWVRDWEQQTGQPKLWVGTMMPGWDDRTADCEPNVRAPAPPHKLDRAFGATYEATFRSALASNPDWLILGSFNEWVEGSYVEPGELYGDFYLRLTAEFIREFKNQ